MLNLTPHISPSPLISLCLSRNLSLSLSSLSYPSYGLPFPFAIGPFDTPCIVHIFFPSLILTHSHSLYPPPFLAPPRSSSHPLLLSFNSLPLPHLPEFFHMLPSNSPPPSHSSLYISPIHILTFSPYFHTFSISFSSLLPNIFPLSFRYLIYILLPSSIYPHPILSSNTSEYPLLLPSHITCCTLIPLSFPTFLLPVALFPSFLPFPTFPLLPLHSFLSP